MSARPLSWPHRHRDRHQLAVGFVVRRLVAEIDIGSANLPPDILNVRHGEAASVIWPHGVLLAVQRIVDVELLAHGDGKPRPDIAMIALLADSRSLDHSCAGLLKQCSVLLITRLIGCRDSVIQRQCVAKHESERGNHGQAQERFKSTKEKGSESPR